MGSTLENQRRASVWSVLVLLASFGAAPLAGHGPVATPTTSPAMSETTSSAVPPASQRIGAGDSDLTSLSLEDLMNVEVSSVSKKTQSIADAPAAVSVISQEDIHRSGFSTIPDLLRLAPGVDVGRINSSSWAVGVRGLNNQFNNNLLVLQDGRSLYTPVFAGTTWDTVDYVLADLDRIEVIRGPGATLYGANAVNGVINITSKDARETQGWLAETRGSNDDSNLSVRYGSKLTDDTFYRAYIKASYFNELDDRSGDNAGDNWSAIRGGFRIDKHPSEQNSFTLQGDLGDNRVRDTVFLPVPVPPFVQSARSNRSDVAGNLLSRWNHTFSEDSDFALQIYYDFLKPTSKRNIYTQNTFDLDFHQRAKLDQRNEVTWGLGYRIVNALVRPTPELSANPSTRNDNLFSAFIQDTITLVPNRWAVTIGSKFEHNDYTGFNIEPSGRLLWTPDRKNSIWAAVSKANRTPSRVSDDGAILTGFAPFPTGPGTTAPAAITLTGNPQQQSEQLLAYEVGYRLEPITNVSLDVAAFYNHYSRKESTLPGAPVFGSQIVLPIRFGNVYSGETYGGEISATLKVTQNWRLMGSYSLLEANFGPDTNDAGAAPQNMAQIRSYLDITKNLQFNVGMYYAGAVSDYNIPAFISTDLNLTWQPREALELSVGVLNLFDNHHPEYGVRVEGLVSETPRTVYVQMSYKF